MANAQDFTYSKGYLGLLSTLGASLGIIFCCASAVPIIYRQVREAYFKRAARAAPIDEENAAIALETQNEISLAMSDDNLVQTHDRSALWNIDDEQLTAYVKRPSRAVHIDEENVAAASETPNEIPLPVTENYATQTHTRSARWSMDGRVAGAEPPPYGGLQRHRTS